MFFCCISAFLLKGVLFGFGSHVETSTLARLFESRLTVTQD